MNGVQYKGDGYTSCEGEEVLLLGSLVYIH